MRRLAALAMVLVLVGAAAPAHAAGWYLLAHPVLLTTTPNLIGTQAPLRYWAQLGSYETGEACERDKWDYWKIVNNLGDDPTVVGRALNRLDAQGVPRITNPEVLHERVNNLLCVTSDDPRLAR